MRYLLILIFFLLSKGILQAQACTVTVANPTPSICLGTSAVLTATGATTYSWSTGATTASISVSPTTTTVYTVTGIAGTCTQVVTTTVTVKPLPILVISPASPTVCFSSALTLTVSGASTYTWNTGATTTTISITPTVNTTYTATGTATNGCVNSIVKTVTVNPNVIVTNATPSICIGSSVALVASGATTYSWSTGATTASISVSPTITTTYTVRGTTGSCSKTLSTTVYPASIPNTTVSSTSPSVCAGNSATLTASGANTYSWSTGPTTTTLVVTPTVTTTYTVRGTTNGCAKTVSITITRIALPTVAIAPASPTVCSGSAIVLTASGASTYTWNTGPTTTTISVTPTVNTTYTVTGTATTSCKNTAIKTVTVIALPNTTITNPTPTVCAGKPVLITGNNATTYTWTPGSATTPTISVSPTVTTNYTVTGRANGCSKTATTTVSVTALPNVSLTPASPTVCSGNAITLTGSGATTYSWNTGALTSTISVSPLTNTSYTVTGIGATGCSMTAVKIVTVSNQIQVSTATPTICAGASATLTTSGSSTYSWSTGSTATSVVVSPTVNTTYTVQGTVGSCVKTLSVTITVNPLPIIGITSTATSICVGNSAALTASGAATYSWSNGATTTSISVSPTVTTTYSVTGTSGLGCINTATININTLCTNSYKTAWTNFVATRFSNDTIYTNRNNTFTSAFSFPYATSKNTLKANTNGWAEVLITSATNYIMLGFHDSTSVNNSGYLDIDFGFYKNLTNTYIWRAGTSSGVTACTAGDLVRIEKVGNIFYYKINGVTQYTMSSTTTKDLKLKVAINTNAVANIVASFIDSTNSYFPNYVQDIPKIKHCSPGLNDGSITLTPKIAGAAHTFTWAVNSSTASSVSGLSPGNYNVDVKDANLNSSKQNYNIGYKTSWTNFFGTKFRNDSLLISNALISWPSAVSKNTLKPNTDGWAETVLQASTDFIMLGFHDSTSVTNQGYFDIDYGFYKNNGSFYAIIFGNFVVIGNPVVGDVIRIERIGTTFYLKRNGFVVHTATVSNSKSWKLKAALNINSLSNIGASFIDTTAADFPNYVRSLPVIKHGSGLNVNDGSIKLSPKYADFQRTYTWTPSGENNSMVNNKGFGTYNVIVTDSFQNSSKFNYEVLYKTKWTSANNSILRNDSVLVVSGYLGYASGVSKNILKANTDGKVSWTVDKFASNRMVGFADVTSTVSGVWSDIDYGIYETQGKVFYLSGGSFTNTGLYYEAGDVLKLERVSNVIKCYLNGIQVYSITAANTNVDWKVKTTITASNSISNVGCSFNTPLDVIVDKDHASSTNATDGYAIVSPSAGATIERLVWNDAATTNTRTSLSPGSYTVFVSDSARTDIIGKVVNIGVKPQWGIIQHATIDEDVFDLDGSDPLGYVISNNVIANNKTTWYEVKIDNTTHDFSIGYIAVVDTIGLYPISSSSLMVDRGRLLSELETKAVANTFTFATSDSIFNLGADYDNLHMLRLKNGKMRSLLNGSSYKKTYNYQLGDVIKIGRDENGKIYFAINEEIVFTHTYNSNAQFFYPTMITSNSVRIKKKGVGGIIGDPVVINCNSLIGQYALFADPNIYTPVNEGSPVTLTGNFTQVSWSSMFAPVYLPIPSPPIVYNWQPGNQNTQAITVTPPSTTTYTVSVTYLGCLFTYPVTVTVIPKVYAVLKRSLDGGFYKVTANNTVYFKYDGEYKNNTPLNYKIYKPDRTLLASSTLPTLPACTFNMVQSNYGDNRFAINLPTCIPAVTNAYYVLEVTNEKNEQFFLKFKY